MYKKIQSQIPLLTFCKGDAHYSFLETGDIYEFQKGYMMINQFMGNMTDGAISNIYLRIHKENGEIKVYPLRGKASQAVLRKNEERLSFESNVEGVNCKVEFIPSSENLWFWKVTLTGTSAECDLVYVQDPGVADKGAIMNNTLYVSQYLDHKIMENENGYVIGSRQNMDQGGRNPYLQQGCLGKRIVGYATDAMQVYGRHSKLTHIPEALYQENLPNDKYQYELALVALQTEKFVLDGEVTLGFYGYFTENFPKKTEIIEEADMIEAAWQQIEAADEMECVNGVSYTDCIGAKYSSECFTKEEVDALFPEKKLEEYQDDMLLSFFLDGHRHVVLQEKEVRMERPHGHILVANLPHEELDKELLTATTYMFGVFCSQIVIGNTDSNPLLTNTKGLLNLHNEYGLRVYVKLDGKYSLLTMPAAYEIGLNYTKWYYKMDGDVLTITTFMTAENNALVVKAESANNKEYEFLVTMSLALGTGGVAEDAQLKEIENGVSLKPSTNKPSTTLYPDLEYVVTFTKGEAVISDDKIFYEDNQTRNALLLTGKVGGEFELVVRATLENKPLSDDKGYVCETEEKKFIESYKTFLGGLELTCDARSREADRFNEVFYWYLHNAFIHYAVPHGLEQSGGAAWGTRDVCQGPMELFLATGHFALARNTLLEIFARQNKGDGEWPQWFMFDKYPYAAGDCHGDVIFWPPKCIGDYVAATDDTSIFDEVIVYRDGGEATILEHLKRAVESIRERYLFNTYLISYAGGDWDDTLQPANKQLKERLCSAWTQALAYQSLSVLKNAVAKVDAAFAEELEADCAGIKRDFTNYLIKDGVIAGFALVESENEISYMLHPLDETTGLNYRLLPLTRSIIAELVTPDQAWFNNQIIDEKLTFPDGVRLMDKPAEYNGGIIKNFVRAEQATNVGREISLQYVHAHIRYVESMAKLGRPEKVTEGLLKINPVAIKDTVKNAALRQANTYFSSSEGDYKDRYDFKDNFEKLRSGEIDTKGGWRIYSSGPGIYLGRLIKDMLGIRVTNESVTFDPAIDPAWDGLKLNYNVCGKDYVFTYNVKEKGYGVVSVKAGDKELINENAEANGVYRASGVVIDKAWLEGLDTNEIVLNLL